MTWQDIFGALFLAAAWLESTSVETQYSTQEPLTNKISQECKLNQIMWHKHKQMKKNKNCQQSLCTADDAMLWQNVNASVDMLNT